MIAVFDRLPSGLHVEKKQRPDHCYTCVQSVMAAARHFAEANACFVDEDFPRALALYDDAIAQDPTNADYCVKRAACHTKLGDYADAVADASRALQLKPKHVQALMRKGVACYHLGEYQTALKAFETGLEIEPKNALFLTWRAKCAALCAPLVSSGPDTPPASLQASPQSALTADVPSTVENRIRHDWYQTATHVMVSVMIKKANKEDVAVEFGPRTLSVDVKLPVTGTTYNLEVDLADEILPGECTWEVYGSKIEVRLKKRSGVKWNTLEWTGEETPAHSTMAMPVASAGSTATASSAAKRGPRDWDKLVVEIVEEEKQEKPEGDAALNKLFQDIYANADEDTKRAMNKSFVESGGTVLSTNWKEVGSKTLECTPPEGMEAKKYT